MPRASAAKATTKVCLEKKEGDFLAFVDDNESFQKWKYGQNGSSIPVAQFAPIKCYFLGRGKQGIINEASDLNLDNAFGTHDRDWCVREILTHGVVESADSRERHYEHNIHEQR